MLARVVLVVLVACGSPHAPPAPAPAAAPPAPIVAPAPPPPAPIAVTGGATVLADVPAWDMAAAASHVIVVDDGFLTTSALDAATGAPAWHRAIEREARGWHTLHADGAHLIEWAGAQLLVLDPGTGATLASRETSYNGEPYDRGGCGILVDRGVCAQSCQCSFTLFDCATAAPIGKRREKLYMEMFPSDGPPSAGCWASPDLAIGAAGDLVVFATDEKGDKDEGSVPTVAAVDRKTGTDAWRAKLSVSAQPERYGATPDGKTCWVTLDTGAASVRDCATGTELWQGPAAGRDEPHAIGFAVAPSGARSLFEQRGASVALYEERTGHVRWRAALAPGTLAWPVGSAPAAPNYLNGLAALALLDPETGKELARAALPADARTLASGPDLLAVALPDALVVYAAADLRELGRVPGAYGKVIVEGGAGPLRIAAFARTGTAIGRVVLVAVSAR